MYEHLINATDISFKQQIIRRLILYLENENKLWEITDSKFIAGDKFDRCLS